MNRFEGAALAVALVLGSLAGCDLLGINKTGGPPGVMQGLTCAHNPCEVPVAVTGSGANCVPTVPDPIIVNKAGGAVTIRWLAPNGYRFGNEPAPNEGIHYKNGPGPINPRPGWVEGGRVWQVVDTPDPHAPARVDIPYQIRLVADMLLSRRKSVPGRS